MRSMTKSCLLGVLFTACTAAAVSAQMSILEEYHVDPSWDAGGYWEFTVTNNTGNAVYMLAIGNVGANYIEVRYPDLYGVWSPKREGVTDWNVNEVSFPGAEWTIPDTSTLPSSTYFPFAEQVLIYYVVGPNPPLADGATMNGLYFNYPLPAVQTAPASRTVARVLPAGSPFIAIGINGELVAQGTTVGAPLATEATTWGGVKALFR